MPAVIKPSLILSLVVLAGACQRDSLPDGADAGPQGDDGTPPSDLSTGGPAEDASTGITPGMAVGKFCHQLRRTPGFIDLTLVFGDPAIAMITARTDTCAPPAGQPCVPIPVGRVPLRLLEGDKLLGSRTVVLENGNEYGFEPVVLATGQIAIVGGALGTGSCQKFAFPDAGGRDGGPADDAAIADTAAD